jgi:putrescine transport system permease protein
VRNYAFLLSDSLYLDAYLSSLRIAMIATLLTLLIGYPMAYAIAMAAPSRRPILLMLVILPFWTSFLIRIYAWRGLLSENGLVNAVIRATGISSDPGTILGTEWAIYLGIVYAYLPFMVLPLYATLERFDWRLVEAAQDLYAGRWQTLRRVVIPVSMPGILAGCVLVFIPSIGSFLASDLLGGGKQMMLGNLIQMQFGFSRDWPLGSALSVVVMAIVMFGLMLMVRKGKGAGSLV